MLEEFSGERLRLARLLKGLTLQEVGDTVHVTRQSIHQFESGLRTPSEEILSALSETLGVTEKFFSMAMVSEVKLEQCHFRKRKTTPVTIANRVLAYSTVLENLVDKLHDNLELPENRFNLLDNDKIPELTAPVIEKIAEGTRQRWGLPLDAPLDNMIDVAENAGAVVAYFDGVSEKVDALSVNRKYPLIIRNSAKESVCRMRFDVAHECGHLIMHSGVETGCKATEQEADSFASAFLFPRTAFAKEFPACLNGKSIIWKEVYRLKIRWKMSARAIIYRAHYLGFIDAQQYRAANVWFNRTRQSRTERHDEDIPKEEPHLLKSAIELMRVELGVDFASIAEVLGIQSDTLSQITGIYHEVHEESPYDDVVVPFNF